MLTLPVARYTFEVELTNKLRVGAYAGSALRGAFGWQLRRLTCITRMPACEGCNLRATCPYAVIFEPEPHPKQASPMPYVIEPPVTADQPLSVGELFQFNMVLMGPALAQLALIILVWEKVFERGLSKQGHGRGNLLRVWHIGQSSERRMVYGDDEHESFENIQSHNACIQLPELKEQSDKTIGSLAVEFATPMRLKHQGIRVGAQNFTAEAFAQAAVRRFMQLDKAFFHSQHVPSRSEPSINLAVTHSELTWYDWTRYSNRQKNYMQLGGLVGHLHLEGEDLNTFYPYLYAGQFWHLGKNTSFGLGSYILKEIA